MNSLQHINSLGDHLFRETSGKMVAVLCRIYGFNNVERVMDVVQDTFETALVHWRYSAIPVNAAAWLMHVAKNKAVNVFTKDAKTINITPADFPEASENSDFNDQMWFDKGIEDSQLRLLLACCHPSLSDKSQVIITLHALCGFGLAEIANALMMNKEAVKKSITRAKFALAQLGGSLCDSSQNIAVSRIANVHIILYLMFNEGYKATRCAETINNDLCYEAIRLTKLLLSSTSEYNSETNAILALMFFNLARFPSRLDEDGEFITLRDQDRNKWNQVFIEEGYHYLSEATKTDKISRYHLEAIIVSLHSSATSFEDTDWSTIAGLYGKLEEICSSPMISLNKVVAESYIDDLRQCLLKLEHLHATSLANSCMLYAAKGDLLLRIGDTVTAKTEFEKALTFATSAIDRRFLRGRILECN
jgi:RNA polymerase sigma factor (sigma-70 family)